MNLIISWTRRLKRGAVAGEEEEGGRLGGCNPQGLGPWEEGRLGAPLRHQRHSCGLVRRTKMIATCLESFGPAPSSQV